MKKRYLLLVIPPALLLAYSLHAFITQGPTFFFYPDGIITEKRVFGPTLLPAQTEVLSVEGSQAEVVNASSLWISCEGCRVLVKLPGSWKPIYEGNVHEGRLLLLLDAEYSSPEVLSGKVFFVWPLSSGYLTFEVPGRTTLWNQGVIPLGRFSYPCMVIHRILPDLSQETEIRFEGDLPLGQVFFPQWGCTGTVEGDRVLLPCGPLRLSNGKASNWLPGAQLEVCLPECRRIIPGNATELDILP